MDTKSSNLALWESVCTTDPDHTKDFKGAGGFSGTAINSTYQVRKATQAFGPLGIGWGYSILSERFDRGCLLVGKGEDGKAFVHDGIASVIHTIHLRLWYTLDGKKGEVEHFGHTPFVYQNKFGAQTESEHSKKSLTDALGKCLSMLGFSADIFLGEYDDAEYREQVKTEFDIEKAESRDTEVDTKRAELTEHVRKHIETIKTCVTQHELNQVAKVVLRHLERQGKIKELASIAQNASRAVNAEYERKKEEFTNAKAV